MAIAGNRSYATTSSDSIASSARKNCTDEFPSNLPPLKFSITCAIDRKPEHISSAASFIDSCADNYAHRLTEVLPRIAAFCSSDKYRDVPLLVDAGLHENIITSLKIVAGPSGLSLRCLLRESSRPTGSM